MWNAAEKPMEMLARHEKNPPSSEQRKYIISQAMSETWTPIYEVLHVSAHDKRPALF